MKLVQTPRQAAIVSNKLNVTVRNNGTDVTHVLARTQDGTWVYVK